MQCNVVGVLGSQKSKALTNGVKYRGYLVPSVANAHKKRTIISPVIEVAARGETGLQERVCQR